MFNFKNWPLFLTLFIAINLVSLSHAQSPKLFENLSPLDIQIEADFSELLENKYIHKEGDGIEGKFKVGEQIFSVMINTSGNMRMSCDLPPLKIRFSKKEVKNTLFEGNHKLKLVTHCGNTFSRKIRSENLVREYKYYRRYSKKTDFHFKTRLLRAKYIDTKGKHEELRIENHLAFFIESDSSVEKRTDSTEMKFSETGSSLEPHPGLTIDSKHYKKILHFNSFIRNGDWSISQDKKSNIFYRKNVKIFVKGNVAYPIPYDFDRANKIISRNYLFYYSSKYLDD